MDVESADAASTMRSSRTRSITRTNQPSDSLHGSRFSFLRTSWSPSTTTLQRIANACWQLKSPIFLCRCIGRPMVRRVVQPASPGGPAHFHLAIRTTIGTALRHAARIVRTTTAVICRPVCRPAIMRIIGSATWVAVVRLPDLTNRPAMTVITPAAATVLTHTNLLRDHLRWCWMRRHSDNPRRAYGSFCTTEAPDRFVPIGPDKVDRRPVGGVSADGILRLLSPIRPPHALAGC